MVNQSRASRRSEDDSDTDRRPPNKRKRSYRDRAPLTHADRVEVGLMRGDHGQVPASFVGSASGIHFIRSVYSAVRGPQAQKELPAHTPESEVVPGEDDRLGPNGSATPTSLWLPSEVSSTEDNTSALGVTFEDLIEWTRSYFDIWHPAFPFLHAPSVLHTLENMAKTGTLTDSSLENVTVRALISISLADHRQSGRVNAKTVPASLVFSSFAAAIESIQPAVTRPATIAALQAVVCVQLFLTSMLRHNAASRLAGLAIRMAYQLGLHRCPMRYPNIPVTEREIRQRLFWTIYILDRHISQSLGLPLGIRDDDIDVCAPGKEQHSVQSQGENSAKHSTPISADNAFNQQTIHQQVDERLRLLGFLQRHAEIKGSIMELRNKKVSQRSSDHEMATLLQSKITQWWNDVEDCIDQSDTHQIALRPIHKAVLTVSRHESVIALNRPLLAASKKTVEYNAALHTCIGASKAVIGELSALFDTTRNAAAHSESFFWPPFTWSVWMSAFILIYAATEREVPVAVALK